MAFWNYRMFHRQVRNIVGDIEDEFTIREAYYGDDGGVHSWTAEPSHPYGETKFGLMDDVSAMAKAISQPVIELTPDASAVSDSYFVIPMDSESNWGVCPGCLAHLERLADFPGKEKMRQYHKEHTDRGYRWDGERWEGQGSPDGE